MQFTDLWDANTGSSVGPGPGNHGNSISRTHRKSQKHLMKRVHMYRPTLGEELEIVKQDHLVKTHPAINRNRRTLVLTKDTAASWGFTIQSYGIQHEIASDVEDLTFVDYVDIEGPAFHAGMRKGDIILSVNGVSTDAINHRSLVNIIKSHHNSMRLVVLFEDCVRKIELHLRYIKLKKLLLMKEFEMNSIDKKIKRLHQVEKVTNPRRLSIVTSASCPMLLDDHWSLLPQSAPPTTVSLDGRSEVDKAPATETIAMSPQKGSSLSRVPSFPHLSANLTVMPMPENNEALEKNQLSASVTHLDISQSGSGTEDYYSLPHQGKENSPNSLRLPSRPKVLRLSSYRQHSSAASPISQATTEKRLWSRASTRSLSFHVSSRQSMSPARCQSYTKSSNFVLTESNCLQLAEPRLLRFRGQNLDLCSPESEMINQVAVHGLSYPQSNQILRPDPLNSEECEHSGVGSRLRPSQPASYGNTTSGSQPIKSAHEHSLVIPKLVYNVHDCQVPKTSPRHQASTRHTDADNKTTQAYPQQSHDTEDHPHSPRNIGPAFNSPHQTCDLAVTIDNPTRFSTTSTESSTSSGFYEDPFSPSLRDASEFPFVTRPAETPVLSSLKRVTRRALMYSRHKDIVTEKLPPMHINEEDNVTRL